MRVTDINEGALVECKKCGNITSRMAYSPPWWSKTSRFILSLILTFILGISASLIASWLYEKYSKSGNAGIKYEFPIIKKR
jgi:hypothetical protein